MLHFHTAAVYSTLLLKEIIRMNAPTSRRRLLQLLGGAPLLPLSSTLAGVAPLLTACGDSGSSAAAVYRSVSFSSMDAPTLTHAAQMATTSVGSVMTVNFSDGTNTAYTLSYDTFFQTGTQAPDGNGGTTLAGGYYNILGNPIMDTSVSSPGRQFFSDCPDGTSLLKLGTPSTVSGITGNAVYAVVQFEYATRNLAGANDAIGVQTNSMYGKLPSPIAVLTLDQNPSTGKLTLKKYATVDTSSAHGLWITCGSSLSPWNTHLSSEEYEPDARTIASNTQFQAFIQNLYGDVNASSDPRKANPYLYGHLPEVTVRPDGTGSIVKHYCLGRISHELVQVLPDNRTVLMGDDATNGGYFMFVADTAKDLSAGTLYVAQLATSLTSVDPATAATTLNWVKLGHATSAEVEALASTLSFTDIMDYSATDPGDATYSKIYLGGSAQWVRVKSGMDKAAAFLETHRYAAIKGGSMGFSKMEGTTLNAADKVVYSALSYCKDSMVASNSKHDPNSKVDLAAALNAGAVMALKLGGGVRDTAGAAIDSVWVPTSIQSLLTGADLSSADALGNTADANKIANPDNLKFSETMRVLFIGEDSGMHVNNFLWAYHVDTKALSRVLSCPSGAESTGLHAADSLNGWTYIMSNFQHPGDWEAPLHNVVKPTLDPLIRANYNDRYGAAVGYLTASPKQPKLNP